MLKIRVWDRERMYDQDYEGPYEYKARQIFTDRDGYIKFSDMNGRVNIHMYNLDRYMVDIFAE